MTDYTKSDVGFYTTELYLYARNKKPIVQRERIYMKDGTKWKLRSTKASLLSTNQYLKTCDLQYGKILGVSRRTYGATHYGHICTGMTYYNPAKTLKVVLEFTTRRV